jgi:hypothetical protein
MECSSRVTGVCDRPHVSAIKVSIQAPLTAVTKIHRLTVGLQVLPPGRARHTQIQTTSSLCNTRQFTHLGTQRQARQILRSGSPKSNNADLNPTVRNTGYCYPQRAGAMEYGLESDGNIVRNSVLYGRLPGDPIPRWIGACSWLYDMWRWMGRC